MKIKPKSYSIYCNEQWCYMDVDSGNPVEEKSITNYIKKVNNGGIYYNPAEEVFFISSKATQKKGYTPSIRFDLSNDSEDTDGSEGYIVDYIFSNNDEYINSLKNNMKSLGIYIRNNRAAQRQTVLETTDKLLSNIAHADLSNIVCAVVDAILNGKSVLLYGQAKATNDHLNIIFYSLRCLPLKLANSIIVNTNVKVGDNEKHQFLGYITNNMNINGVCSFDISNYRETECQFSNFYTVYLKWMIDNNGILNFDSVVGVENTEIIKHLNIMALNNLSDGGEEEKAKLKQIIWFTNKEYLVSIIEDSMLVQPKRVFLENLIQEEDSLKYIYICNATKSQEQICKQNCKIDASVCINEQDLLEIEKFYKEYSTDNVAKEFVKNVFLQCISLIKVFDDEKIFKLVYRLKIYMAIDINEMGFMFVNKSHKKYIETAKFNTEARKNKEKKEASISSSANKLNEKRKEKWFLQSSAFTSAIALIVPIIIGIMLFTVPDKIWKYIAIILNVDTWYIMPIVLIFILLCVFGFYIIPYMIMRKNTVHLNGFSNIESTVVSCICMILAVLIPILSFVLCAAIVL